MIGETVVFHIPTDGGHDDMGNEVDGVPKHVEVANVLVAPGSSFYDLTGALRTNGDACDITLYLPKAAQPISLRGATVSIPKTAPGRTFSVIGNPFHYPTSLCPTDWSCVVKCKEVQG